MRVAAIFGPGASQKNLAPFQETGKATWLTGLPATSAEADAILILGGDGTIHRHLATLVELQLPVLVVPCGSGNDFARALGLGRVRKSLAAWCKFQSGGGNVRAIDLGVITPGENSGTVATHYFCCVGGVGIDGEVARRANGLPSWLRAHGGYALSVVPAVFGFAPIPMRIQLPSDESGGWTGETTEPTILAAFANAPAYGSGMRIAPKAQLDDGRLNVCMIRDINKLKLLCLFPTVYFGRHLGIAEVEYFQTERLRLETPEPCDVYADGEFVCRTPIEVNVARNALRVIVPSPV
jgi:diacylglycerol kinase (ATP)